MIIIASSVFAKISCFDVALLVLENESNYKIEHCKFTSITNENNLSKSGVLYCYDGELEISCCSFERCLSLNKNNNGAANSLYKSFGSLKINYICCSSCCPLNFSFHADSPVFVLCTNTYRTSGENHSSCRSGSFGSVSVEISDYCNNADIKFMNVENGIGERAIYLRKKGLSHSNIINCSTEIFLCNVSHASTCCFFLNSFNVFSSFNLQLSNIFTDNTSIASITTKYTSIHDSNLEYICIDHQKNTEFKKSNCPKHIIVATYFILATLSEP